MKTISLCVLTALMLTGSVFADLPAPDRRDSPSPDEPRPFGPIIAGVGLALALGVGGVVLVKNLRKNQEKPNGDEKARVPAEAK